MKKLFLFVMIGSSSFILAQKMKVLSGNFDFLKGEKELNVQFDYSNATFYNEKMTESQYVDKRAKEISKDKGEAEVEIWKADWKYSKETSFMEKFLASMNKNVAIKTSVNPDAKYTVIVETIWIYPGWFAGVMNQPSKVSTLLKFVESANPSNILLTIEATKAPGDNFIGLPNNNDRIAEGYAKTGKSLAKMIDKKID